MPKVVLLSHTPEPEKTVALAAKLCYTGSGIEKIKDGITKESAESFLDMLMEIGHESPIEHISFTFGIEGVSRVLLAQITRHRLASYSVQSQRYVEEDGFCYITPPSIENNSEAKKEFLKAINQAQESYKKITELLKTEYIENNEKNANKAAIEDARFVLPNACATKMIVTMNARSLLNFFKHRCCMRSQWEIREVADLMLAEVLKVAPSIFSYAGPACLFSKCSEGKMSCGKQKEIKEKYQNMKQED
jgi:thymidylate synthase (FAD)